MSLLMSVNSYGIPVNGCFCAGEREDTGEGELWCAVESTLEEEEVGEGECACITIVGSCSAISGEERGNAQWGEKRCGICFLNLLFI